MKYDKLKKIYIDFINEVNPFGFELKAQRSRLDRTLSSISYKLISPSYLCKVENNQAILKNNYVKEVCKRLEIEPDKIGFIKNSKDKIEEAMLAYLLENKKTLEKLVVEGEGLLNYVYKLIRVLHFLSNNKIIDAKNELQEIDQCIKSINAHDLKYVAAVYVAFDFKTSRLDYAYEGIKALKDMEPNRFLELYINYFTLKLYLVWNNPKLSSLIDYFKYNPYARSFTQLYARICYFYEFSCLKQDKKYEIDTFSLVDYPELIRNLIIFKDFLNNKSTHKPTQKTPQFLVLLYEIGIGKNKTEDVKNLNGLIVDVDYSKLYLEYLCEKEETKLDFILSKAIPYICNTNSSFLRGYFLKETVLLAEKYKRYKLIYDIYLRLS